jgi:hypothetical protein
VRYQLSDHAREALRERKIELGLVEQVLDEPQQRLDEQLGRKAYQSRFTSKRGIDFLLRLIVDESTDPLTVVTLYWTSRVTRYWREP